MRKLILALTAFACLTGAADAQQQQKFTADQGAAGATPWPVAWTGQSVLADLRVAGSPVAAGNPVPVTVGNFPATQTIAGTVTANQGAAGAAAWKVDGSGVTQPVSGTVATSNGALDATVTARLGTLGQKASAGSAPVVIASDQSALALSPNAATAANQTSEIAQLTAIATRLVPFVESSTVAPSTTFKGAVRDVGSPGAYTRVNAVLYAQQAGTLSIFGCNDSGCGASLLLQQQSVSAGGTVFLTQALPTRYWQIWYNNSSASATSSITLSSAMAAN